MPSLILVRHGNTFEKDQTPTFVGGRTDMPLTATGEAQARAVAQRILDQFAPLNAIICGPLKRTHRMAEIIAHEAHQVFTVDERLCEIDYGLWENKTSAEVRALYGDAIVDAWEKDGCWPEDMNWAPSREKLLRNAEHVLAEQHKKLTAPEATNRVIITSNGILRFVFQAVTGRAPDHAAKVGTGCYCVLDATAEGWRVAGWNLKP